MFCVHHDLQTLKEYFDHVILLNQRAVDYGPVEQILTSHNLRLTYGGRSAFLAGVQQEDAAPTAKPNG